MAAASQDWHHEVGSGRWSVAALRALPQGEPEFTHVRKDHWSVRIAGREVGHITKYGAIGWMAKVDGFEWRADPNRGSDVPDKAFSTLRTCEGVDDGRQAVRYVLATRPKDVPDTPLPDKDGWLPIGTAPRTTKDVRVRNAQGEQVAHFACDLSGEDQPPFGPGWFYPVKDEQGRVLMFAEVLPKPTHWQPVDAGAAHG